MPKRRVLVVEDHADSAEAMAQLLQLWGHDVRITHDGPSALEVALAYRPDVVLLDIGLPGRMDGYELAENLKRQSNEPPFTIALTGYSGDADAQRLAHAGIDRHLTKPVDVEMLDSLLERDHQDTLR